MITACAIFLCFLPEVPAHDAYASRYDPGVMEATVNARLEWGHVTQQQVDSHDGYVAVGDCGRIGETVYLRDASRPDQPWLKMLVTDCAGDAAAAEFMRYMAVEVDGRTAAKWGFDCHCPWPIEMRVEATV